MKHILYYYHLHLDLPILQQTSHDNQIPLRTNSTVTLQCRATGDGSLKYYWERNDSGNWITVDNNNRTSYTTGTTGQYRCNVTNEVGSVVSPVITVYGKEFNADRQTTIVSYCSYILILSVQLYDICTQLQVLWKASLPKLQIMLML